MVCRGHCFGNGLIMRAVGDRMIIAPPLVITRAQIDEMVALIRRCLDLTLADVRAALAGTADGTAVEHSPRLPRDGTLPRLPQSLSPLIPIPWRFLDHGQTHSRCVPLACSAPLALCVVGTAAPRRRRRFSTSTTGPTTSPKTRSRTSRRKPASRSATTTSTTTRSCTPSWWPARRATTSSCRRRTGPSCRSTAACCASSTRRSCRT